MKTKIGWILYVVTLASCIAINIGFLFWWNDWIGALSGAYVFFCASIPIAQYRENRIKTFVMEEARDALRADRRWLVTNRLSDAQAMKAVLTEYNVMAEQYDKLPWRDAATGHFVSPKASPGEEST